MKYLRHLPDGGLVTTYDENYDNLIATGSWEALDAPKDEPKAEPEAPKPGPSKK